MPVVKPKRRPVYPAPDAETRELSAQRRRLLISQPLLADWAAVPPHVVYRGERGTGRAWRPEERIRLRLVLDTVASVAQEAQRLRATGAGDRA